MHVNRYCNKTYYNKGWHEIVIVIKNYYKNNDRYYKKCCKSHFIIITSMYKSIETGLDRYIGIVYTVQKRL